MQCQETIQRASSSEFTNQTAQVTLKYRPPNDSARITCCCCCLTLSIILPRPEMSSLKQARRRVKSLCRNSGQPGRRRRPGDALDKESPKSPYSHHPTFHSSHILFPSNPRSHPTKVMIRSFPKQLSNVALRSRARGLHIDAKQRVADHARRIGTSAIAEKPVVAVAR